MKPINFLILLIFLFVSCEKSGSDGGSLPSKPDAPKGLSAVKAWEFFQLSSTGSNGDLYSVWSNKDAKLNREGMINTADGYWNLTYKDICGKEYLKKRERSANPDNLGTFAPLSPCNWNADSYDAVRIADANGGSEYSTIYSLTAASGNGNLFGYEGQTFWVLIYQKEQGKNSQRLFLVSIGGQFIKRMDFL